jgi:hypothetical protein
VWISRSRYRPPPPRPARSTSLGRQQPCKGCERRASACIAQENARGATRSERPVSLGVQSLLPHELQAVPYDGIPGRRTATPPRRRCPSDSSIRIVFIAIPWYPLPGRRACAPRGWSRKPHFVRLAPEGWKEQDQQQAALRLGEAHQHSPEQSVSAQESRAAWARLIAKVYEVDLLRCARCGSRRPRDRSPHSKRTTTV